MDILKLLNDEIVNYGKILSFEKGNIVVHENDECVSAYLILDGEIKISTTDLDGKEDLYNYLKTGDMFANILVFSKRNYFLGDVIAMKKTTLLEIKKEALLELFKTNASFLKWFLEYNSCETMESKILNKLLSKRSIKERILYFIDVNHGEIEMSITTLSKKIMINRVCVSRVVSDLVKEKVIKKVGKKLIII